MPRFALPWPALVPVLLLAGLAVADQINTRTPTPRGRMVRDATKPIVLPPAPAAPTDPVEFDLYHAARMVRRANAAGAIGQEEVAGEWIRQARTAAIRVARGAATASQRQRALALLDSAREPGAPLPPADVVTAK